MARIEQHGSDTYIVKDIPEDGMINYFELVNFITEAIRVGNLDLREIADDQLQRIVSEEIENQQI